MYIELQQLRYTGSKLRLSRGLSEIIGEITKLMLAWFHDVCIGLGSLFLYSYVLLQNTARPCLLYFKKLYIMDIKMPVYPLKERSKYLSNYVDDNTPCCQSDIEENGCLTWVGRRLNPSSNQPAKTKHFWSWHHEEMGT